MYLGYKWFWTNLIEIDLTLLTINGEVKVLLILWLVIGFTLFLFDEWRIGHWIVKVKSDFLVVIRIRSLFFLYIQIFSSCSDLYEGYVDFCFLCSMTKRTWKENYLNCNHGIWRWSNQWMYNVCSFKDLTDWVMFKG